MNTDPHQHHELHDRWDSLTVIMLGPLSKPNIRVQEDSCIIGGSAEIVKLLYHHGRMETNLRKDEPTPDNLRINEQPRLDEIEGHVIDHEPNCAPFITNVSSSV